MKIFGSGAVALVGPVLRWMRQSRISLGGLPRHEAFCWHNASRLIDGTPSQFRGHSGAMRKSNWRCTRIWSSTDAPKAQGPGLSLAMGRWPWHRFPTFLIPGVARVRSAPLGWHRGSSTSPMPGGTAPPLAVPLRRGGAPLPDRQERPTRLREGWRRAGVRGYPPSGPERLVGCAAATVSALGGENVWGDPP